MKNTNAKVRILIITAVLVLAALSLMSNTSAAPSATDLRSLDAGDEMAYRWEAMGNFYRDQAAQNTAPPANGLNALDGGDPLAYHWEAMGSFYRLQANPNQGQ
jgi:hypothetical protein